MARRAATSRSRVSCGAAYTDFTTVNCSCVDSYNWYLAPLNGHEKLVSKICTYYDPLGNPIFCLYYVVRNC